MLVQLLIQLLPILLPDLEKLLVPFLTNVLAAKAEDVSSVVLQIVADIATAHPDWSNEQKRQSAFDAIQLAATAREKVLPDALVNAMIELAVQQLKVKEPPA